MVNGRGLRPPEYETAYFFLGVLNFLSWVAIAVGIFALLGAFYTFGGAGGPFLGPALVYGDIIMFFVGFGGLLSVQLSKAVIDNATYSWHILQLLSKGGWPDSAAPAGRPGASEKPVETVMLRGKIGVRKGFVMEDGRYKFETLAGERIFENLEDARRHFGG